MTSLLPKPLLPFLAILFSALIWGISTPITKALLGDIPPFSLALIRFTLASLILLPIGRYLHLEVKVRRSDWWKLLVIGLFGITGNIGFGFMGIKLATALDSITFASMTPLAIALASTLFLGERMTKIKFAGQVLAVIGALMVISSPTGKTDNRILGDILLALSGTSWVISVILSKEMSRRYHSFTITQIIFFVGMVSFVPLSLLEYWQNSSWVTQINPWNWLGVVFLGLFTSVLGYLAFEWGLERSTASFAGIINHFELLIGAIVAAILLGELLSQGFVVGASLILLGVAISTRPSHHYHKAHAR